MRQVIEMTYQEKYDMFMKLDKEEIIKMLIESNKHLEQTYPVYPNWYIYHPEPTVCPEPQYPWWEVTCNSE